MVGGSGDFYVSQKDLPYFSETSAFFRQVVEMGHPVFASCFGFHVMTHALGGEIIYDPDNMEVGTYEIALTGFARGDELFRDLPLAFQAQLGHKDRASKLPPSVVNLGYSQRCPYQAFRVPGAPIWATQFHPELTGEENLLRYHRYLDGYASVMSPEERDQALSRFSESPETHNLIPRFLALIA
jgi:GMP synthase (glutamine-hydrolysing)